MLAVTHWWFYLQGSIAEGHSRAKPTQTKSPFVKYTGKPGKTKGFQIYSSGPWDPIKRQEVPPRLNSNWTDSIFHTRIACNVSFQKICIRFLKLGRQWKKKKRSVLEKKGLSEAWMSYAWLSMCWTLWQTPQFAWGARFPLSVAWPAYMVPGISRTWCLTAWNFTASSVAGVPSLHAGSLYLWTPLFQAYTNIHLPPYPRNPVHWS